MARKSTSAATVDDFGLLSAIWILSCNDQIPYMTYEGIKQRLGLPPEYDVRLLIAAHGELFRARVPNERLNEWKEEMFAGRRLPSWIREKTELRDRRVAIESLHTREKSRPEYVGRSGTAWRLCYETVQNTILEEELKQARVQSATQGSIEFI